MIKQFVGSNAFLSNFHPSPIVVDGISFKTVEHAYQAAKTDDKTIKRKIAEMESPGKAKRAGGRRGLIKDLDTTWDTRKVKVMFDLVKLKFKDPDLRVQLLGTGDEELEEGNAWGDTTWGVCLKTGKGDNLLGRILMKVRREISTKESVPAS